VVAQRVVNEGPGPILAPAPIATIHSLPRAEIPRQQSPSTAGTNDIEDRVDQAATIQSARSTTFSFSRFRRRNQRSDIFPFFICQVRWVASWMRLHPIHL